jgi:hypothetical protein
MRRLAKRLALISLVLFVPIVILWVQSYRNPFETSFNFNRHGRNGGVELISEWEWNIRSVDGAVDVHLTGSFEEWNTPYWKLLCLASVAPIWRFVPWNDLTPRQRRKNRGCCPDCGYDLRATPDRCPECGRAIV